MSSRSSRRHRAFAGNHQRSWLWGRHAVTEVLRASRWPVLELFLSREDQGLTDLIEAGSAYSETKLHSADDERLTQLCGHADHQGVVARMGTFPIADESDLLDLLSERPPGEGNTLPPLVVVCDRIQDAFNFGAILRNCDAMRVDAVVIGDHDQAAVTPHVARASSGAVNHVSLFRTHALTELIGKLRTIEFMTVAASEKSATTVSACRFGGAVALVIGSEAHGVAEDLLNACECRVAIPMLGSVGSLNAAVASGILLHEIRRQQQAF